MFVTGQPAVFSDIETISTSDLTKAEMYAFPLCLIALVLAFGTPGASALLSQTQADLAKAEAEKREARQAAKAKEEKQQASRPKGVSRETYDAISIGMSKKAVVEMLGTPDSETRTETPGIGIVEMCHWQKGMMKIKAIDVFFQNGVVTDRSWTEL